MATRPAFQFYPGDWMRNAALRRCTHAERGIWIDVMCLMHDSEEYGVLRWPLKDIAQACGCRVPDLRSLVTKGVLKGSDTRCPALVFEPRHAGRTGAAVTLIAEQDGPLWYSSRMVRDQYVADRRAGVARSHIGDDKGSPNGTPDQQPKGAPIPPFGDLPSSAVCSSTYHPHTKTDTDQPRADDGEGRDDGEPAPNPVARFRQRWDGAAGGYAGDDRSAVGEVASAIAQREADRLARGE